MRQFLIALCKILAVLGILVLLAAAVFSPRWAARPEDVKVPAPTPLPTAAPTPESTAAPTPAPTATPGPEATAEPTATPTPEPTPTVYTISVLGDCTLASYPEIRFWETSIENVVGENYDYPFSHTAELFDLDDLTIINLECSISDQQGWAASTFSFKAPAAYTEILTRGGVDFATTANNHALDFGQAILDDTVENLEKAGIVTCVEKQSVLYTTDSGLMVGVYADYNGHLPSKDKVAEEVKKLKDAGAEAIVVCLHWGEEASYYQTGSQVEVAHAAIDAGATVVAGHGPHRLQPCEEYNGGVIFYSLANFIFGGNTQPQDMDTVVAQAMVTRELDGTVHYSGFRVYPASISSQSPLNDYCPTLFDEGTAEYARAMSKVDGSWTGANNTIDYSFMHQDEG